MKRHFIDQVLTKEDREAISQAIHMTETVTSGEIRLVVRERRHFGEKGLSLEKIALREFHRLDLSKTRDRTAILLFLLLSERKFHIVADEGIHRNVADGTWERVANSMGVEFKKGKFRQGIIEGLELVGKILSETLPPKPGDRNELSNKVIVEE